MGRDSVDDVRNAVRNTLTGLRDTMTFKPQREQASRAIDSARKSARDTVSKYRDKAKRAVSSRSSGRR